MSKLTAVVKEIKDQRNGEGFIVHFETPVVDPFGETTIHKYLRAYNSLSNQDDMIGKKVSFNEDNVVSSKFTLPEDHEYAGNVITKYWIKGSMELVK